MRNPIRLAAVWGMLIPLAMVPLSFAGPSEKSLAVPCNGCHGSEGVSSGTSIPSIAGQHAEFLARVMLEYKQGKRSGTIMNRIARGYKEYELSKIARYFARKPWRSGGDKQESGLLERGQRVHRQHCAECHEDSGRYQDRDVPRIAGQPSRYLLMQMMLYREGVENLPQPSEMADKMALIDDTDMQALAELYANTR